MQISHPTHPLYGQTVTVVGEVRPKTNPNAIQLRIDHPQIGRTIVPKAWTLPPDTLLPPPEYPPPSSATTLLQLAKLVQTIQAKQEQSHETTPHPLATAHPQAAAALHPEPCSAATTPPPDTATPRQGESPA